MRPSSRPLPARLPVFPSLTSLRLLALATLSAAMLSGAATAATVSGMPAPEAARATPPVVLAAIGAQPDEDGAASKAPVPATPRLQSKETQRAAERPQEPQGPIDNWKTFDAHFEACLEPVAGPEDATLTLRFAVDAKGRLKGKPMATYSKLPGGRDEQQAFVIDALNSLARCLPLQVTPRFGPIVAARPLILRFLAPPAKQRGI